MKNTPTVLSSLAAAVLDSPPTSPVQSTLPSAASDANDPWAAAFGVLLADLPIQPVNIPDRSTDM
jgi:hypothetical protein